MRRSGRAKSARVVTRIAAVVLLCLYVAVALPHQAGATTRTLAADPASGLVDQVVAVHWSGFHPTTPAGQFTVTVYQCKASPASLDDCYQLARPPAGADANGTGVQDAVTKPDGTGSVSLEVRPALDLPQLDCTFTNPCSVIAFENDGKVIPPGHLPSSAITATLRFAASPADCPQVKTPDVTTEGEASTAHALYGWSADLCTGARPLSLDYTELSSPAGRRDFLAGNVDIGLTSMPASAAEKAGSARASAFAYAPIDLTGVVVAFNVVDSVTQQRITDMNLTPRLVAILIAGNQFGGPGQNLFLDPEFLRLNPGHHWPQSTQPPLLRAERNADAYLLTSWLQQDAAARRFLEGKDRTTPVDPFWKGIAYPTDIFEARDPNTTGRYNPRTGTLANVRRLFNFQPPGDGVLVSPSTDGLLGVMDAVTAQSFGLPTAKLRPANATSSTPFTAADSSGLAAGYEAMHKNADGLTKTADVAHPGGYPLVKVDYAMVPTHGITQAKADHIGQFLDFVASSGQEPGNLPPGYVPLPQELRTQDANAHELVLRGVPKASAPPPSSVPPSSDFGTSTEFVVPNDSGSAGSAADTAQAPAASGSSSQPAPPAELASHSRPLPGNPVLQALRDFLGGDHHMLLPVILVLAVVALAAGPMLILKSQGKLRRPRRRSGEARSSPA